MAPPRLLQNSRRGTPHTLAPAFSSSASRHRAEGTDELPPYEAPAQPLNDAARRALTQVSSSRTTKKFEVHLKRSADLLRSAVGATNDRAYSANDTWKARELILQTKEVAKRTQDDTEFQKYAEGLVEDVSRVTTQLEAALRDIIDYRVELEDEDPVLKRVHDQASAEAQAWKPSQPLQARARRKPRRPTGTNNDEEAEEEVEEEEEDVEMDDPDENAPVTGVTEMLLNARQINAEAWIQESMEQRYAKDNDYIIFRRTLHDALHPNDTIPVPHATTWFGTDGQPVMPKIGASSAPDEDDEDDELRVMQEVRSHRCPLSLVVMTEPYSNRKCTHSFNKGAILELIRGNNGTCQCPVPGCSQVFAADDFYLDEVLLRQIKRAQQAAAQAEEDEFDDGANPSEEEVDDDGDMIITGQRSMKRERHRSRGVTAIEEDD